MSADGSFERFYLGQVALGEGCGCAEQIIGTRDLEERSRPAAPAPGTADGRCGRWAWLVHIWRRAKA